MDKKYVLVTGGSRGIGAAIVERLIEKAYDPIILDITEPLIKSKALFFKVDLTNLEESKSVLSKVCSGYKILHLVNNVGVVRPALVQDCDPEDFSELMNLNARTGMLCLQALLPAMDSAKYGRVVSITSRALLGKEKRTAYAASKAALAAMTRTWALELAHKGITCNTIAPGPIETEAFKKNNPPEAASTKAIIDNIPLKRMGKPQDVANAVCFFLEAESGFITGQTLYVCGGITVGLKGE